MFEYIKGKLIEASPLKTVVEAGGIGYLLFTPVSLLGKLPQTGHDVLLYLFQVVREDAHQLYAFLTKSERNLFKMLTEISGIGPKTALALLGHMEISQLERAVSTASVAALCKIPGIGKKTAERLIIEMRDKIKTISRELPAPSGNMASSVLDDALSALINLGYNQIQAQKALESALAASKKDPTLSDLITTALRTI